MGRSGHGSGSCGRIYAREFPVSYFVLLVTAETERENVTANPKFEGKYFKIRNSPVGTYSDLEEAFIAAKSAAGDSTAPLRMRDHGVWSISGPLGTAWVMP